MKYKNGEEFLNKMYTKMYLEDTVANHTKNGDTPAGKIGKYIERLDKIHEEAKDNDRKLHVLKQFYYKNYLIKELPENYIQLQKRILRERGYGDIEVSNNQKEEWLKQIQEEQKHSLDTWIDYLMSDDAMYPMWFKNYAFRGMLTLNKFDKEKESFGKRTSSTVESFVDLNRESLAMVYDILRKEINTDTLTEEQESLLAKGESFKKLYTHYYINNLPKDMDKETEGIWIKYSQGEDYKPLWESLQGKNTGWCTAGEKTCKNQIEGGDFYVYYTKDLEGNFVNPRIAIRMDGTSSIGEVRGIGKDQNLEENMTLIAEEKLKEFPNYEKYKKKVSDMKMLTEIDHKEQKGIILSKEELRFLYEIDNKIEGFGYESDPRIKEIQGKRDVKKDLSFVLDCKEENIALTKKDLEKHHCIITYGFDFDKNSLEYMENLKLVYGDICLDSLTSIKKLVLPEKLTGKLHLHFLESADNLVLPKIVNGYVDLAGLKTAKGLVLPEKMNGDLILGRLKTADGLVLPKELNGGLLLNGLESTDNLVLPKILNGGLELSGVKTAEGLILPEELNGSLYLDGLESTDNLVLPKILNGGLGLSGLKIAEGLILPEELNGRLYLNGLESAEGLVLPEKLNGGLSLGSLESTEGLILPKEINGHLNLGGLKTAEGLILPKGINGYLGLGNLENAEELMLPERLNGDLDLCSLKTAEGLVLPEKLNGDLDLCSLKTAEGLVLPEELNGRLYLESLESVEGLVLPEKMNGYLYLYSLKSTDTLTLPESYINNKIYTNAQIFYIPDLEYFNKEHKGVKK